MKVSLNKSNTKQSQKQKKSIWNHNKLPNKQEDSSPVSLDRCLRQRTLKIEKTKLFKPINTLSRNNVKSQKNKKKPIQDENSIVDENIFEKQIIKQNHKVNQNIICIQDQLETYENMKFNSFNILNSEKKSKKQDINMDEEDICLEVEQNKQKFSQCLREPLCDISNKTQNIQLQIQQKQQEQEINNSLNSIFSNSKSMISEDDDENERILAEKFQKQNIQKELQPTESINSSLLALSTSSIENLQKNEQTILQSQSVSEQRDNDQKKINDKPEEQQASENNKYFDGYQEYKKREKVFTFRIFKEDFLKIPTEFSKIITHSQDDDVSSDEDVARGGIKYNYKSLIKEIYKESEIGNAPLLVISSKYFE